MVKGEYMLKLEIKMDEEKINTNQQYSPSGIYTTLEQIFKKYQLNMEPKPDGTIV